MIVSHNELDSLAKRAARGAGNSWGMAAEVGKATRWLVAHGLPGVSALADLLAWRDARSIDGLAPPDISLRWDDGIVRDPVAVAATACDLTEVLVAGPAELGAVRQPLLVAFHLAAAGRRAGTDLVVEWGGGALGLGPDLPVIELDGSLADEAVVRCRPGTIGGNVTVATITPHEPDPAAWALIESFAARTYAPATDDSRRKGAGAGLIDD